MFKKDLTRIPSIFYFLKFIKKKKGERKRKGRKFHKVRAGPAPGPRTTTGHAPGPATGPPPGQTSTPGPTPGRTSRPGPFDIFS